MMDELWRPIRTDRADGGFSVVAYGAESRTDPFNAPSTTPLDTVLYKNPEGHLTRRLFDGSRVVWVDECDSVEFDTADLSSVTCDNADQTYYTFEPSGEVSEIFNARQVAAGDLPNADPALRYTYDTLGRVLRIEDSNLAGTGFTASEYHPGGTVAETTNARGEIRSYSYDALDRLIGIATPSDEPDYAVSYESGGDRYLHPKVEGAGFYTQGYAYDSLGQVERSSLVVANGLGGWEGFITDYEYDLAGRTNMIVHPDTETTVRYEYEGAYLKRVCDLGSASDCSSSAARALISDVVYDALGRRTETHSESGVRTFEFDETTQRLKRDHFAGSNDPYWFERQYTEYDRLGNLLTIEGGTSLGQTIPIAESYAYDHRDRLRTWTKEGTAVSYEYDEIGNMTKHAGRTQYYYDPDRPNMLTQLLDGGLYGHDDDGNVSSITGSGGDRYFAFDSANQLTCAGTSAGQCNISSFKYDIHGRRLIAMQAGGSFRIYTGSGFGYHGGTIEQAFIEIEAFGDRLAIKQIPEPGRRTTSLELVPVPPREFWWLAPFAILPLAIWGARRSAFVLVAARPLQAGTAMASAASLLLPSVPLAGGGGGPTFYWELSDRLGTGTVLVDENGEGVRHTLYEPFGKEYLTVGTAQTFRRYYAGHRRNDDVGLDYMQARWYDPESGTFLSLDPLVAIPDDPQTYNPYTYARNNPILFIDPSGMSISPESSGDTVLEYEQGNGLKIEVTVENSSGGVWIAPLDSTPGVGSGSGSGASSGGTSGVTSGGGMAAVPDMAAAAQGGMSPVQVAMHPGPEEMFEGGGPVAEGISDFDAEFLMGGTGIGGIGRIPARAGGMRSGARSRGANLRKMGLAGVKLKGSSYNTGRKALEGAGFRLERTTGTGRKVFVNDRTGAVVTHDSGKALAAGQKNHWTIQDKGGAFYDASGRPVSGPHPPMGGKHIPGD